MIKIWDIEGQFYWHDETDPDEPELVFENETAAKNMMYTEGYTYEYMAAAVEFHPFSPIINDKSGYDLQ
jgi:hypothetical protein